MAETPTTELEAVNQMLAAIGESPVNTLENNGVVDAVLARQILKNVSRQYQAMGWHWNTEQAFEITPTSPDGFLIPPTNTLKIDLVDGDLDLVQRGARLYDRVNHTYQFTKSYKFDIVVFLPFEELPEAARQFFMLEAGVRFQANFVGSQTLNAFTERDAARAWVILLNAEGDTADHNILDNAPVARVMDRVTTRGGW